MRMKKKTERTLWRCSASRHVGLPVDKHDLKRAECSFHEVNVFIAQREFVNVKMWGRGGGNLNISVRAVLGGRVWGSCVFSKNGSSVHALCTHCVPSAAAFRSFIRASRRHQFIIYFFQLSSGLNKLLPATPLPKVRPVLTCWKASNGFLFPRPFAKRASKKPFKF